MHLPLFFQASAMKDILFIVFFTIGATALCGAILSQELVRYFENIQLLEESTESVEKLESLISDYDELLKQRQDDPNLIKRAIAITMGVDINEPDTVYPKLTANELQAARITLARQQQEKDKKTAVPQLLLRCNEPQRRLGLFLAGASLVLVSFVCFNPGKKAKD